MSRLTRPYSLDRLIFAIVLACLVALAMWIWP